MESPEAILTSIAELSRRERRLIASFRGEVRDVEAGTEKVSALIDAARALDAAAIPYALIGGVAVGIHSGAPRATLDVDLAALGGESGRDRVIAALTGAGLAKTGEFPHSINFRHPSGEPVQVAFDPEFDAMILRAESFEVAGVRVRIVRREDLLAMKERAAADPGRRKSKRLRDQADIELLRGDVPEPDEGW
jgi:hypothetical protein